MLHPTIYLAAIGFSAPAREKLAQSLASFAELTGPKWRLARHERADAWLVHPDVVDIEADHARVWDSVDRVAAAVVRFDRLLRPVALAAGLAADGVQPTLPEQAREILLLDSLDAPALHRTLMSFEQRLRLLRSQFAFGEILLTQRPEITREQRGYQLIYRQTLIAMVDTLNMRVHIGPKAVPISINESAWQPRPVAAAEPAASEYHSFTVQECLWEFSQRSEQAWLPARYKSKPIYFWRTPSTRSGFFQDEHLGLLTMLQAKSQDFARLKQQTGWSDQLLIKTLEGLWVTGAISTLPMKPVTAAGLLERLFSRKTQESDSGLPTDSSSPAPARGLDWARDTSPSPLTDQDNSAKK